MIERACEWGEPFTFFYPMESLTNPGVFNASAAVVTASAFYVDTFTGNAVNIPLLSNSPFHVQGGMYGLRFSATETRHKCVCVKITATGMMDQMLILYPVDVAAEENRRADYIRRRNTTNVLAAAHRGIDAKAFRSLEGLICRWVNKYYVDQATNQLVLTEPDDLSIIGRQSLTADPSAVPVVAVDTV